MRYVSVTNHTPEVNAAIRAYQEAQASNPNVKGDLPLVQGRAPEPIVTLREKIAALGVGLALEPPAHIKAKYEEKLAELGARQVLASCGVEAG